MSEIIWHQLPKDLIKVICKFAEDNPQPTALSVFLANSNKLDWGSLSRNPMSFSSNDALAVWHRQTCPNVDDTAASVNIVRINWDLLSRAIRQEERQIEPVQTKHGALLMRLALLMQIKF
jgi:hypothetical protein